MSRRVRFLKYEGPLAPIAFLKNVPEDFRLSRDEQRLEAQRQRERDGAEFLAAALLEHTDLPPEAQAVVAARLTRSCLKATFAKEVEGYHIYLALLAVAIGDHADKLNNEATREEAIKTITKEMKARAADLNAAANAVLSPLGAATPAFRIANYTAAAGLIERLQQVDPAQLVEVRPKLEQIKERALVEDWAQAAAGDLYGNLLRRYGESRGKPLPPALQEFEQSLVDYLREGLGKLRDGTLAHLELQPLGTLALSAAMHGLEEARAAGGVMRDTVTRSAGYTAAARTFLQTFCEVDVQGSADLAELYSHSGLPTPNYLRANLAKGLAIKWELDSRAYGPAVEQHRAVLLAAATASQGMMQRVERVEGRLGPDSGGGLLVQRVERMEWRLDLINTIITRAFDLVPGAASNPEIPALLATLEASAAPAAAAEVQGLGQRVQRMERRLHLISRAITKLLDLVPGAASHPEIQALLPTLEASAAPAAAGEALAAARGRSDAL